MRRRRPDGLSGSTAEPVVTSRRQPVIVLVQVALGCLMLAGAVSFLRDGDQLAAALPLVGLLAVVLTSDGKIIVYEDRIYLRTLLSGRRWLSPEQIREVERTPLSAWRIVPTSGQRSKEIGRGSFRNWAALVEALGVYCDRHQIPMARAKQDAPSRSTVP